MRSAIEKRDQHRPPELIEVLVAKNSNYPVGTMLIPSPLAVQAILLKLKKSQVLTNSELRSQLAVAWNATYSCALTTGIFLRIVAEAAEEERAQGKTKIAPWWRVVKDDGRLNSKTPGGEARHAQLLAAEGHKINVVRGKFKVDCA